jgi:hypothetical protein
MVAGGSRSDFSLGVSDADETMSATGTKRTFAFVVRESAFDPKRT